jgi:hypothetical protein
MHNEQSLNGLCPFIYYESLINQINGVDDFVIGGTNFPIRMVEDLEFGLGVTKIPMPMGTRG